MGFFSICKGDPVINSLREIFKANPLRIPEKRVQPISVLAKKDKKVSFRGSLSPLLLGDEALDIKIHTSPMPQLSNKKTREVGADMGVDICGDLLKGFGVPGVDLSASLNRSNDFSFSFSNVERHYIDINDLGLALQNRIINKDNPASSIFYQRTNNFMLVDSVITSDGFSIDFSKSSNANAQGKVDAIKEILKETNANVKVTTNSEQNISFDGGDRLTFAFTCVEFIIDPSTNKIISVNPSASNVTFESATKVPKVVLGEEPSLLEWDDFE